MQEEKKEGLRSAYLDAISEQGNPEEVFSDPSSEPYLLRKKLDLFLTETVFTFSYEEVEKLMCPALYLWDSGQILARGSRFWVEVFTEGYVDASEWCMGKNRKYPGLLVIPDIDNLKRDSVELLKHILASNEYTSEHLTGCAERFIHLQECFMYLVREGLVNVPKIPGIGTFQPLPHYGPVKEYLVYQQEISFDLGQILNFPVKDIEYLLERKMVNSIACQVEDIDRAELVPLFKQAFLTRKRTGGIPFPMLSLGSVSCKSFEFFQAFMQDKELKDSLLKIKPSVVQDIRVLKSVLGMGYTYTTRSEVASIISSTEHGGASSILELLKNADESCFPIFLAEAKYPVMKAYLERKNLVPSSLDTYGAFRFGYPSPEMATLLKQYITSDKYKNMLMACLPSTCRNCDIDFLIYSFREGDLEHPHIFHRLLRDSILARKPGSERLIDFLLGEAGKREPNPLLSLELLHTTEICKTCIAYDDIKLLRKFLDYGMKPDIDKILEYILTRENHFPFRCLEYLTRTQDIRYNPAVVKWLKGNKLLVKKVLSISSLYTEDERKLLLEK